MKTLILGAKGMLGKALVEEFSQGFEVVAYDKKDLDIANKNSVNAKIKELKPELVINAAAYNAVDKIEENSEDYKLAEQINGYAVGFIAEACKELAIPLVHYSSDYVFRGDNKSGYDEGSSVEPVNKYGQTKAFGEKMLKVGTSQYYLIRVSRLFGPAGDSEHSKKSFVDLMLDLVEKQEREELDLIDEECSCPSYAVDVAKLTRQILEKKMPFGIYHGANDNACTWYEFAQEIFKIKNLTVHPVKSREAGILPRAALFNGVKTNPVSGSRFPRPARRPLYSELLNTKLPKQRGWQEALREYLNKF